MHIVIIGNSVVGLSCIEAFRKHDRTSSVTVIGKETRRPYSRVLLPSYLRGKVAHDKLFIRDDEYYNRLNAHFIHEKVVKLLAEKRAVLLADKTTIPYDKLLITSGSSPVKPAIPGLAGDGIHHLWTLADARRLASYLSPGRRAVVFGAGFVALQAAARVFRHLACSGRSSGKESGLGGKPGMLMAIMAHNISQHHQAFMK